MLVWMLVTLAISYVSFKIGAAYSELKTYEECMQLLFEAKKALADAKLYMSQAKTLVEVMSEEILQETTEAN